MFQSIFKSITKEFSGRNAKEVIGGITNFHRIQSSPGFRAAAKYCLERLNEYGIPNTKILSYPAQGSNHFWGCPVPKEWSITSASLDIVEPKEAVKNLCRFFENPCSIIQRSKATPPDGITAEAIIVPKDLSEDEIKNLNVKGKFIVTDEPDLDKIRRIAINKFGAEGIIYDLVTELRPIRTRANFPTARRYTSFWYGTKGEEGDALGFVLSAQLGEDLRNLIAKIQKEDKEKEKSVKLQAKIDSKFYDGEMEVVEFFIPGEEEGQEVIAVAHLCHPKPGAVDNASGCGTLIEVARTLNSLVQNGTLKGPKRGIRFLLMAEFTGTYCYLASFENKINNFIAGINLDMVGADQCVDGGRTLIMERSHNATPSYVNDVLSSILDNAGQQVSNFTNTSAIATFKYANDQPFSGGSDHAVFTHPDINVGMPMFIQWPDRYYHTGEDTIEKVSPEMLHIIGSITAAYCYFIANASLPEITWIIREVTSKGKERITKFTRGKINHLLPRLQEKKENSKETPEQIISEFLDKIDEQLNFRSNIELEAIASTIKLATDNEEKKIIEKSIAEMKEIIQEHTEIERKQFKKDIENYAKIISLKLQEKQTKEEEKLPEEAKLIPKRTYKGPFTGLGLNDLTIKEANELQKINDEYKGMRSVMGSAFYWIDGKRTIEEVAKLAEFDIGISSIPYLVKILRFLEKQNLIEF